MEKQITIDNKQVVVMLRGSMYVEDAAVLREDLLGHITKGYNTFVLDMSALDYIDSSGLGVLVAINKRALQAGGSVILVGLKGVVKELFELTRLHKIFKIQA